MNPGIVRYLLITSLAVGAFFGSDNAPAYTGGDALVATDWASVCDDDYSPPDDPEKAAAPEMANPTEPVCGHNPGHIPASAPTRRTFYAHPARAPPGS